MENNDIMTYFVYFIALLLIVIPLFYLLYYFSYENLTFIVEKRLLKSQKKQEKYKGQLKRLSILNDLEAKSELVEEIETKLIHEEFNSKRFYYILKQKKIDKQKKELYRNLKKNDVLEELDNFDGIKITDKRTRTQYIFNDESVLVEKDNNDELTLKIQKWNPAQELLISYIRECDLTVFEVEKIQDFIRKELKAKRYKEEIGKEQKP